ncbi:Tryptophan--tRNA ligase, mitochondrial, partial [Entophlyctis luteolus]
MATAPTSAYLLPKTTLQSFLRIPAYSNVPVPTPASTLVGRVTIKSFMPDHANFVAYYARHAALKRRISAQLPVHLRTELRRWHVTKAPFVFDKTKEVFEQKTYAVQVQVYDTDVDSVRAWIAHVNSNLPAGVSMVAETFEHSDFGSLDASIARLESMVKSEQERARQAAEAALGPAEAAAQELGKRKLTFEEDVRARADAFVKNAMKAGMSASVSACTLSQQTNEPIAMAAGPCKHNTRTRLTRCVSLFAAFLPLLLHSRAGPPEAAPRVLLQVSLICPLQSNGSLQQQLRQTHAAINSVTYSNLSALAQTTQIFVVLKSSKFLTDLKPLSCPEYILQEFQQYFPIGSPPVKLICQNSSTDLISTRDSIFQEMQFNRNHSNAIMFLDHCEAFVDDSALAQFVKVFQKTRDGFVFSNIFKARESEYEEVEFTEESYNQYDITIATTLNTEEPNEKRSPIPPTTSMLVPLALMEKYYKSRNVAESICAAGIKEFETSEVQASSLDIQKFWHLLALSDVGAYFIPVPLLIHTGTKPSNAHHDRRMSVNLKAVKAKFPLGIKHLATLKSRWRPSLSVIIPFYNVPHGLWFLHTMRSISAQSFSDFEIIIVDDGSDKSFESFGFLSELEEKVLQND